VCCVIADREQAEPGHEQGKHQDRQGLREGQQRYDAECRRLSSVSAFIVEPPVE
jgi:hypothetical protein